MVTIRTRLQRELAGEEGALADAAHPEHASMLEWAGGRYDPDGFRPDAVAFSDPKIRLRLAFEDE